MARRPKTADGRGSPAEQALAVELTTLVLAQVAPDELVVLDDTAAEYFADPAAALRPVGGDTPLSPAYDQPDLPSTHTTTEFNELPVTTRPWGNFMSLLFRSRGRAAHAGHMTRRRWAWAGGGASAVSLGLLIAYLTSVGLERANNLAAVLGLFVSLLALGVAVLELLRPRETGPSLGQTDVHGSVSRISRVGGGVRIRRGAPRVPPIVPQQTGPRSRVDGHHDHIERVGGDVELNEEP
ncbi:hypothetical protein [Streptomyces sp. NPDC019890]|uniref:hypothetical protein n=1 Tax=Streptomyces sp. NPDC019890 TaxID=3365064 RepID=UPI00384BA2F0